MHEREQGEPDHEHQGDEVELVDVGERLGLRLRVVIEHGDRAPARRDSRSGPSSALGPRYPFTDPATNPSAIHRWMNM
jgi:hypothetical protein